MTPSSSSSSYGSSRMSQHHPVIDSPLAIPDFTDLQPIVSESTSIDQREPRSVVAPPQSKRGRPLNHYHSAQDCVCAAEAAAVEVRCGHFGVSHKRPGPKRRCESKRLGSDSRP
jgi:hypothetical protein